MARTAMIVSASRALMEMVAWVFEGTQYSLSRAGNTAEALEKLEYEDITCIMLDLLTLPSIRGFLHELDAKPALKTIPLVFLSNEDDSLCQNLDLAQFRYTKIRVPFNRESFLSVLNLLVL